MRIELTLSTRVSCTVRLCRPVKCPLWLGCWFETELSKRFCWIGLYGHMCACFEMEINLLCLGMLFHHELVLHVIYPNQNIINAHRKDVETQECSLFVNIRSCSVLTLYSSLIIRNYLISGLSFAFTELVLYACMQKLMDTWSDRIMTRGNTELVRLSGNASDL